VDAQLQYATLQTSTHNGHQEHGVPMDASSVWPLNRRICYYLHFRSNKGFKGENNLTSSLDVLMLFPLIGIWVMIPGLFLDAYV